MNKRRSKPAKPKPATSKKAAKPKPATSKKAAKPKPAKPKLATSKNTAKPKPATSKAAKPKPATSKAAKPKPAEDANATTAGRSSEDPAAIEGLPSRRTARDGGEAALPIVGIGASAGGLEALEAFFRSLPPKPGVAFVVVTHKHPGHVSVLPELLGRCTSMEVVEADDGVVVRANTVYVAPAADYLAILNRELHHMPPGAPGGLRFPVDYFFRSLADDQGDRAIGIILSGSGTDGTLGVVAIKGEAGLVMGQDAESAKYSGMPCSAAATTIMDYVAPPAELAGRIVEYSTGVHRRAIEGEADARTLPDAWRKAFVLLRSRTGHDFSSYKANTVRRRFERRMTVHQLGQPEDYVRYLEANPHELDILFKELLIGVTSFFRDAEAWDAVRDAWASLLVSRDPGEPIRVWVVGCSTGEEAYTMGIVLREAMERVQRVLPVQIFATDIDPDAIETARAGRYPGGIAADIHPERLSRHFFEEDSGFRINKDIREMVVFAPQDVIKDPPFTKLDMLSCRNLLIYLEQDVQQRLLPLFHYALRPGGLLLLGPSETTGAAADLFDAVDKKWRLFRRKQLHSDVRIGHKGVLELPPLMPQEGGRARPVPARPASPASIAERVLLTRFVPPTLIISAQGDIVYIHGRTGAYLEPTSGEPSYNAFAMAREGLRLELPAAVRQAASRDEPVVRAGIVVKTNGSEQPTRLTVCKLHEPESMRGLLLVTLQPERREEPAKPKNKQKGTGDRGKRAAELDGELVRTQQRLQGTIEALETSNEELKSTNEELQSTNEELQSANEELETSKEEMQSLNEELQTVNAELQSKMEDLSRANDDMQNLLNSTEIATIFLDSDLRIKRFTDQARGVIRVIDGDIGRPIGDLAHHLAYDRLVEDAEDVLRTLRRKEQEVRTTEGAWRLMRMVPYRTGENLIDGLVITLVDIDQVKRAEREARAAQLLAELTGTGLVMLDRELRVLSVNEPFCRLVGQSQRHLEGARFLEFDGGAWDAPELRTLLEQTASGVRTATRIEMILDGRGDTRLAISAYGVPDSPDEGRIVLAVDDADASARAFRDEPRRSRT